MLLLSRSKGRHWHQPLLCTLISALGFTVTHMSTRAECPKTYGKRWTVFRVCWKYPTDVAHLNF